MSSIEEQTKNVQDDLKEVKDKIKKLEEKIQKLEEDEGNNYKLDIINQNVYLNFL